MRIRITCETNPEHQRTINITGDGVDREYVEDLAGIMDGTSSFYRYPPREYPMEGSLVAKCHWDGCQSWIRCEALEDDDGQA